MATIVVGCLAFGLFIVYDINQITGNLFFFRGFFMIGCLLLTFSTLYLVVTTCGHTAAPFARALCGVFCILFFALMIYSLFFALPFQRTYLQEPRRRRVYDLGMYSLCRHPGVLWFVLFYLTLAPACASKTLFIAGFIFSVCNILYVIWQDFYFFPHIFCDYRQYRHTTPFLVPTRASIRRCLKTIAG